MIRELPKVPLGTLHYNLRLLTHVGFLRQNGLILSEVFCLWKGARILKKYIHRKKITFLRGGGGGVDRKNTVFEMSRNLIFQMTLNARTSCADSFLKIKTDDNQARF